MDLNLKYTINKNRVSWRLISNEAIILHLDSGIYYELNAVGTQIWNAIIEKKSLGQILETLKEEYQVDENHLKSDLKKIVTALEKEKLIEK